MFVLPALKEASSDLLEAGKIAMELRPTPPPPKLAPSLLRLWGIPFESDLPEEGTMRTAIVREYLIGCALWIREFNASLNTVFARAIRYTVKDEAVEREFIEEDADYLAWRCFIKHTCLASIACLERRESTERQFIVGAHLESLLSCVSQYESVHRQLVATQFLESLFLKLCQVKPGWMWRSVPKVFEDGFAERPAALPPWLLEFGRQEQLERREIEHSFLRGILLSLEVFVAVEKRLMYQANVLRIDETIVAMLGRSATAIQAVFRGYSVRKAYHSTS
ncbi:unnamed protein product [Trypanosoma congolense IL3000]|uniref:WGS project CAEQ00000000 data, annotated contig 1906 n=1 Tax=Trypanosoma congolense (strain IL3000) TaxID=1068625 RepID=F9W9W5_TRYCI|nr:unnamed protein product [Trypanosoma congolense IL3000]